jgi:hypothetical protein
LEAKRCISNGAENNPGTVKRRAMSENNPTSLQFVEAWETSESTHEVAAKLGVPRKVVQSRAHDYRRAGVHLKKRPPGRKRIDVEGLNRRIEEIGRERAA